VSCESELKLLFNSVFYLVTSCIKVSLGFLSNENLTIGEKWKVTDAVLENCIVCRTYVFSRNSGRKRSEPTKLSRS
jgi:hypothetical protein